MYKQHIGYHPPTNLNASIWRYVDFARFMAMLYSSQLWFARLDKMDDHYEGVMPVGQFNVLMTALDSLAIGKPEFKAKVDAARSAMQVEYAQRARNSIFVNCWHLSDFESGAMWKIYGDNSIAVRSTFARLRDSFDVDNDNVEWIGTVRYVDFSNPAEFLDPRVGTGLYKRRMYDFEKEVRAVIHQNLGEAIVGLNVHVNLATLIDAVYVGPGRSEWFVRLVKAMLEHFGLSEKPVQRSGMDGKPLYLA